MKNTVPVLLVPGLACDHVMWSAQIVALESIAKVFVADLPPANCLIDLTSRILSSAPRRFHVVGASMGGYIALEMARQAPERIETMALMVTTPEPDTVDVARRRQELQASVESGDWADLWRKITPRFLSPARKGDTDLIEAFVRQIERTSPEAFLLHQTAMMVRPSYVDLLPEIEFPTNVVIGCDDGIIPPQIQEAMADQIPGAKKTYITGCGHIPTMEKPDIVARVLVDWIAGHSVSNAA